jgi:VRR-NUC domain.
MKEKETELKLVKAVKHTGGMCPKFVSPGLNGMPDRIVLLSEGHMAFVEVKQKGKVPRPLQKMRHKQLQELGYQVYVLDDPEQIQEILKIIGGK